MVRPFSASMGYLNQNSAASTTTSGKMANASYWKSTNHLRMTRTSSVATTLSSGTSAPRTGRSGTRLVRRASAPTVAQSMRARVSAATAPAFGGQWCWFRSALLAWQAGGTRNGAPRVPSVFQAVERPRTAGTWVVRASSRHSRACRGSCWAWQALLGNASPGR